MELKAKPNVKKEVNKNKQLCAGQTASLILKSDDMNGKKIYVAAVCSNVL